MTPKKIIGTMMGMVGAGLSYGALRLVDALLASSPSGAMTAWVVGISAVASFIWGHRTMTHGVQGEYWIE